MYDYSKLLWDCRQRSISLDMLASCAGISQNALSNKLNGKTSFKQDEMIKIMNMIGQPIETIAQYFFCKES